MTILLDMPNNHSNHLKGCSYLLHMRFERYRRLYNSCLGHKRNIATKMQVKMSQVDKQQVHLILNHMMNHQDKQSTHSIHLMKSNCQSHIQYNLMTNQEKTILLHRLTAACYQLDTYTLVDTSSNSFDH